MLIPSGLALFFRCKKQETPKDFLPVRIFIVFLPPPAGNGPQTGVLRRSQTYRTSDGAAYVRAASS